MDELLNSLGEARNAARKHHYKCLCPGCTKNSINSHLVQQHPFLESIAESGYLYQILDNEIDPRSGDTNDLKERQLSIRNALSFPLFCAEHDNNLFKPIETGQLVVSSVDTFLRFGLRALASQRFLEAKRQVLYQNTGFDGWPFDLQRDYSKHIIDRFDYTISVLLKDINAQSFNDYVHDVIELPFQPICGSDAVVDEDEMAYSYEGGDREVRPLSVLFLTLLPYPESKRLKLLIGYNKKYVGPKQKAFFERVCQQRETTQVMDLICRMKNWCCSSSMIAQDNFLTLYEIAHNRIIREGGC